MTKVLWLLRHATAADAAPDGGGDRARPLSGKGRRQAAAIGRDLDGGVLGVEVPALVLCSPASRTLETAELAFGSLRGEVDVAVDQRLYAATPDDVISIVAEQSDDLQGLVLVGHNPTIHQVLIDIVGDGAPPTYAPGTLSVVELEVPSWSELSGASARLITLRIP